MRAEVVPYFNSLLYWQGRSVRQYQISETDSTAWQNSDNAYGARPEYRFCSQFGAGYYNWVLLYIILNPFRESAKIVS